MLKSICIGIFINAEEMALSMAKKKQGGGAPPPPNRGGSGMLFMHVSYVFLIQTLFVFFLA